METPRIDPIKADILLVDDRDDQLLALQTVVADLEQNVVTARSGREALRELLQHDFAVIILDVNMPGMDGYETASLIRQRRNSEHTPIIFVSAYTSTETHISQGYSLGAVDYIQRPVVPEVLRAKVAVFVELYKKSEELRRLQEAEHRRRLEETRLMLEVQTKRNLFFVLSLDMLCIIGFDGYFKQLNPAWHKTLGFGEDQLKANPIVDLVHPADRDTFRAQIERVAAGGEVSYYENRFRCQDGSYRWFGWTAAPFSPGELVYMFARDITESRMVEEERARHLEVERQRAARLRQLAAASIAMNSTVAIEEIVEVATAHARRVLEAKRAVGALAVDSNWSKVHRVRSHSEDDADLGDLDFESSDAEALLRVIEGPLRLDSADLQADARWRPVAADGDRAAGIHNCICAPLTGRQGGNMGYLVVCDRSDGDFTAEDEFLLVQLSQMASLAVTNALYFEAREANRIKDEFLATLSHELRTPLTAILGWTWLLRSGSPDAAALEEAMEIIERNARAQAKLIDDMLDISRIISGKLRLHRQAVRFQAQVEAAVDTVRPLAKAKGVHIDVDIEAQLSPVDGDPDRLHQVVSNLVSNAVKFTPEGGDIRVRVEATAGGTRLAVQDSGIGIAPDFLPHVFERFLQADAGSTRPQGGLGLGLAIVRHLVELHGGRVEARSDGEGKGATFIVELPAFVGREVEPPAGPARELVPLADPRHSIDGLCILVVDDDADSRATIAMVLRQFDARVIEAGSAAEAMAIMTDATNGDGPDLLVSDIAMPEEDGCELIQRIRRLEGRSGDRLPALAVSAFAREEDRARALAAGFQAHVSKPVTPHQLLAAIAALATPHPSA